MGSFVRVDDGICGNDWVGGGDPLRKLKFDECWMVDWYLWWVDDGMMWGRLCAWMIESVTNVGWEAVTP